ncbi:MAG: hydroxylamine reductase [Bacteroidales bacterium]|nr:hydroxylamine reductase [Bacteroidales bacterium]MCF8327541.1 hydroxylamine reductase [Bacteroidales bacterium]
MSMFCFQCQEAAKNEACTTKGVCGKEERTSDMQDLLVFALKGLSFYAHEARKNNIEKDEINSFIFRALFTTITNTNFDDDAIIDYIKDAVQHKLALKHELEQNGISFKKEELPFAAQWHGYTLDEFERTAKVVGPLETQDEDVRSLRELITYGVKGIAAYGEHAENLGEKKPEIYAFMQRALVATTDDSLSVDDLVGLTMETGQYGVEVMQLLDKANTTAYGNPEITEVNLGVRNNPGILISGHDMKDMEELLKQTEGTGVDVYTHSEMLPANYYPAFKKYDHFVGNYGNAWWKQKEEFESFNGPVLFTTNCIVPPSKKSTYKDRVFTTGSSGYPGFKHIPNREDGQPKDFSEIIELAKKCDSPQEIETGTIVGGFAHDQVMQLADKVVDAVKSGAIRQFFVMAGCDGRMKSRDYYTDFAKQLPEDTVILTAGCAKYRYNKLGLGNIGGIPRVLDAGQCNDSYSLAVIAMKLKEVFELNDINDLPISYNIAWYEQKAVIVLLALLYLGVKDIHLGPTLPAFLSPNVTNVLVDKFGIAPINNVEDDIKLFLNEA